MQVFRHSIHVFNADKENVRNRLSQCQYYSENLNLPIIKANAQGIVDCNSPFSQVSQIMRIAKKRKDKVITFYLADDLECVSVYSDFFVLPKAFSMAKDFFADMEALVIAIERIENKIEISVIEHDILLEQISVLCSEDESLPPLIDAVIINQVAGSNILKDQIQISYKLFSQMLHFSCKQRIQYLRNRTEADKYIL